MAEVSVRLPFWNPINLLCTWFGAGLSPKAPGTVGSVAALPFAWIIQLQFGSIGLLIAAVLVFFIGWWASNQYESLTNSHDASQIVIDEVAGMWLLLAFFSPVTTAYIICFLAFRLFDVTKPWPISWADRKVRGGLGVMLDDILAALFPIAIFFLIGNGLSVLGFSWLPISFTRFMKTEYVF